MKFLRYGSLLCGLLFLAGCASVSVKDKQVASGSPQTRPVKIIVRDFDLSESALNVDRTGDELSKYRAQSIENMSLSIVNEITTFYPVERLQANAPLPIGNYLLLEGKITRVNQGSRALRMVVGFGAGGTKMETEVTLSSVSQTTEQRILSFSTSGGSGAEPGLVGDPTPVGAATNIATNTGKGVTDDTKRTARMIAYRVSQYLGAQGWISPEKVKAAKKAQD